MTTLSPFAPEEKPSAKALVLSAMVHLLLLGALFFGVQWKSQAPSAVGVEIWRGTSAPAKTPSKPVEKLPPKPVEPPPKPVEPPPEPVEPPPKPVEPPPEPEVKPPADPDIIAKEKEEALKKREREEADRKKAAEEEQKKLAQRKAEEEQEKLKKAAEEEQKKLAQKKAAEEEQKKLAQKRAAEAAQRRAEDNARLRGELEAEEALRAMGNQIAQDAYAAKIRGRIRGNIVLPRAIQGNPEAIFRVTQLPTGDVIEVQMQRSSGNSSLDEAIERAIHKSSPLPKPDQANAFQRVLILKYKPYDE